MPSNEQRRRAAQRKLDRQLARRAQRARRKRLWAVAGSAAAVVMVVGVVVLITVLGGSADPDTQATAPTLPPVSSTAAAAAQPAGLQIPDKPAEPPQRAEPLPATVQCQYPDSGRPPAKPVEPPEPGPTPARGTVEVTLRTTAGAIPMTLDRALAPCTVKSFLHLARQDFYDNTPCHRLTTTEGFRVLQCGDPTGTGTGDPGYRVPDEAFPGIEYGRGYVALAEPRAGDSGGSQFFIVYGEAKLPPKYTVFGTVSAKGLQVVDKIARAGVQGDGTEDEPTMPVTIKNVVITPQQLGRTARSASQSDEVTR